MAKNKKEAAVFERRPGRFIKSTLSTYGKLAISDLHESYTDGIKNINAGRDRLSRIKQITYPSFYKYVRNLEKLGLVERVGEEDVVDFYGPAEEMGFVERVEGELVVHEGAVKRLWALTGKGISEVEAWDDPVRALGYYPRE